MSSNTTCQSTERWGCNFVTNLLLYSTDKEEKSGPLDEIDAIQGIVQIDVVCYNSILICICLVNDLV
jgi:hypothetical protein